MKPLRAWHLWILGWVLCAVLGLQLIESSHHHDSVALQEACALCQVAAHQPLDTAPPLVSLVAAVLFLLFILLRDRLIFLVGQSRPAPYHSRAPPIQPVFSRISGCLKLIINPAMPGWFWRE